MLTRIFAIFTFFIILSGNSSAQWINEIHYDNSSTDSGECIEIAGPAGTNLSGWQIILYNGGTGASYNTNNISGTIPDEGCGFGAISFCYPTDGIQNGAPDGIALYNGSNVVQFLSYEGTFSAVGGPANGMTSIDIGVSETSSTPVGTSMQLSGSGSGYSDFSWSTGVAATSNSLNAGQTITPCGVAPTLSTGAVTGGPFSVDCSTNDTGSIAYSGTGTFNAGNTFTVQMSDASGSFASPTVVGSVSASGVDPSGSIAITIPAGTPTGTGYRFRIVSSNPNLIAADNGSNISITLSGGPCVLTPPHLTSVIINSCNVLCGEGNNELVFGNTGDFSVLVNEANFNFSYTNSPPTLQNYTDNLTNNATTTQDINDICPTTDPFIDAYGSTIPPNASWVLANDALCPNDALDWSGLCSSGPIYIIYTTDPTWSLGGNFSNTTNDLRPYQTSITTTSGTTFTIDYETDGSLYPDNDGVFATFDSDGGPATSYGDDNCNITPVVLPVELISFEGTNSGKYNSLKWSTASERNSDYFEIEVTKNGVDWSTIGTISASGYSESIEHYNFEHYSPDNTINYYRLLEYSLNGSHVTFTKLVSIDNRYRSESLIGIYNSLGQEIPADTKGLQIHLFEDGSTLKVFND